MNGFIETVESGGKKIYIRAESIQAFNNGGIFFNGNYLIVNDTAAEIAAKILAAEAEQ
jgi:uncharacterized protein YlzI (FlbEa/FlbD family)